MSAAPAGSKSTAALRPDRRATLGGEFFHPHLDRPSVREFVARHSLDVVGVERQQLLVAKHRVVSRASDRVVLRPGGRVLVDVLLGLLHRRERSRRAP